MSRIQLLLHYTPVLRCALCVCLRSYGPLLMMSTAGVTCYRQEPCQQSAVNHQRCKNPAVHQNIFSRQHGLTDSPLNCWTKRTFRHLTVFPTIMQSLKTKIQTKIGEIVFFIKRKLFIRKSFTFNIIAC